MISLTKRKGNINNEHSFLWISFEARWKPKLNDINCASTHDSRFVLCHQAYIIETKHSDKRMIHLQQYHISIDMKHDYQALYLYSSCSCLCSFQKRTRKIALLAKYGIFRLQLLKKKLIVSAQRTNSLFFIPLCSFTINC